jgi:CHAT domain-containing protein
MACTALFCWPAPKPFSSRVAGSVPDLETKDLMIEFYRRYLYGENISKSEALRQAQLAVIEQLRKKYGAAHPAYWGAFVCIGEP